VSSSLEKARWVLQVEADAIERMITRLDETFDRAVETLAACRGRVVTSGMGKSGIICRKIAATFSSTGTPALFMHPAEAVHGDLGMLARGDTVLLVSNSGQTDELLRLLSTIKRLGLPLISFVGDMESKLAAHSDLVLDIGVDQEACAMGLAPTASTAVALALGDALAIALSQKKGFRSEEFARLHPGGELGKHLALVSDLMHVGEAVPVVRQGAIMRQAIAEMSRKGLGVVAVSDAAGRLIGVVSDGDLRRHLERDETTFLDRRVEECMTTSPVTIESKEMATRALDVLEKHRITSLMVIDGSGRIIGIIHLHDLWGTELF
jgi:arabinose-5-phosphate isomerase